MFGMVVYFVLRCSICERSDVRIVPIDQDPYLLFFKYWGQQLRRPEDLALFSRPCIMRVAVQPMDKDDVNVGWSRRRDFGQTKAVDRWNLCFGRSLWGLV